MLLQSGNISIVVLCVFLISLLEDLDSVSGFLAAIRLSMQQAFDFAPLQQQLHVSTSTSDQK